MEILFTLAVLLPFGLGGFALALVAYGRARAADHRVVALERRVEALERERRAGGGAPSA